MTKRIDAGAAYTDIVPESTPFPTILSETDYSPTRAQIVDGAIANKPSAKTVVTTAVNLATDVDNGKTLSGHVLQTGDPFIAVAQTVKSENGPWITSASGAPTRPAWADTGYALAIKAGDTIRCSEGNYSGTTWRLVTTGTVTVDTTAQTWVPAERVLPTTVAAYQNVNRYEAPWPWMQKPQTSPFSVEGGVELWRLGYWRRAGPCKGIGTYIGTAESGREGVLALYRCDPYTYDIGTRIFRAVVDCSTTGNKTGDATLTGTAQSGTSTTITLAAATSEADDALNGRNIRITSGTGAGQVREITDFVGSTDVATVDTAWDTTPDNTSVYSVDIQFYHMEPFWYGALYDPTAYNNIRTEIMEANFAETQIFGTSDTAQKAGYGLLRNGIAVANAFPEPAPTITSAIYTPFNTPSFYVLY